MAVSKLRTMVLHSPIESDKGSAGPKSPSANMATRRNSSPTPHLGSPDLLSKIDGLYACGVGDYVALPQLVVVGDQSAGKSSTLEGLTRLPFPRDSVRCTRFVTQVTFRREPRSMINASILPAKGSSKEHKEKLGRWAQQESHIWGSEKFASLLAEVSEQMGIGSLSGRRKKIYSEDILRIEICGPDEDHFAVVDVPGVFRLLTEGETTKEDILTVENMIRGYMANPRSIMLAVVQAGDMSATGGILQLAKEYDLEGVRTLGILTKPDLVESGSESSVLDVLEGRKHKLRLGWCMVKNASAEERRDATYDRDVSERQYFSECSKWHSLDPDRAGISNLKSRLRSILAAHIQREFPRVKQEIQKQLSHAEAELAELGDRESPEDQRDYLMDICNRFEKETAIALHSDYNSSALFGDSGILRLPTAVVTRSEKFAADVYKFGHRYDLGKLEKPDDAVKDTDAQDDAQPGKSDLLLKEHTEALDDDDYNDDDDNKSYAPVRCFGDDTYAHEIQDMLEDPHTTVEVRVKQDSFGWLVETYKASRGFELATFNTHHLALTMSEQSAKWEPLALGYVSDVIAMVHTFIHRLLERLCADVRVRDALAARLADGLAARYRRAREHVRFLLQVERAGTPATNDAGFGERLRQIAAGRQRGLLVDKAIRFDNDPQHRSFVDMDDVLTALGEDVIRKLGDTLHAYYDVARRRFVDSVCMQAAMHFLVRGDERTPLALFSSRWVSRLSDEDLADIAGEDIGVRTHRANLRAQIKDLVEGKRILR